jgi:hypothetical protein
MAEKSIYISLPSSSMYVFHENRKKYSKALLMELLNWINDIEETGAIIIEFGMIAITDAGNRICQRIGFKKAWEIEEHGETYNVYKGTVNDVRNGIKNRGQTPSELTL